MTTFLIERIYPQGLDRAKKRQFRLQSIPYVLVDEILFRKDSDGFLLRCIQTDQISRLLKEFHDGPAGGHFSARITVMKIMRVGYYWLTLLKYSHRWVGKYEKCAFFSRNK